MFKNILSKVGWGELPSSFGFTIGEKVELPYNSVWAFHKAVKKQDGSAASIFICAKKDLDPSQAAAALNALSVSKSMRHPNVLKALESCEVDSGFYLVTEECVPLLLHPPGEGDEKEPCVWGLYQVLDALGFLHTAGLTHGLVAPTAVYVTPSGDWRLSGFDLAKKGADAAQMVDMRQRVGASVAGWPTAPATLKTGQSPTIGVDLWGAALMAAYVYGAARAGQWGVDLRLDLARAAQDLPQELRKVYAEFLQPGPLRGGEPVKELCTSKFFQEHSQVRIMDFLNSLHIKSPEEKEAFFESLPGLLDQVPKSMQMLQVLSVLLEAQKFPGQEAAQVLPAILKIGVKLKEEDFKAKVAPLVVNLFTSPDRAIRFRLLCSMGDMIHNLEDSMINDKIFPECVNGFTDSNGPIREATVKAMIFFVPRLKAKTVESKVLKQLVKCMTDSEASIRTNCVICCGRIASSLSKAAAADTLTKAVTQGMKDPFAPCRGAALQTLLATKDMFPLEDLANKMMPHVCMRLVDPEVHVADTAYNVMEELTKFMKTQVTERRAAVLAAAVENGGSPAEATKEDSASSKMWGGLSRGSWANSLGSVASVANKLAGSVSKAGDGTPGPTNEAAPQAAMAAAVQAAPAQAAPAQARAPAQAPAQASVQRNSGMSLTKASTPAAASSAPSTQKAAGGWEAEGDFWAELGDASDAAVTTAPTAAAGDGWGDDLDLSDVTVAAVATPAPAAAPAAKPTDARARAKTAPAAAKPAGGEDDFWKEFNMD